MKRFLMYMLAWAIALPMAILTVGFLWVVVWAMYRGFERFG